MTAIPLYLEVGGKRTFACSIEWPGWCRSGRTEEAAIDALLEAAPRYAEVARAAGERFPEVTRDRLEVVERVRGNGTTDFGAPAIATFLDREPLHPRDVKRLQDLLRACWDFFDQVVAGAPPVLRKGPRGGGRDRDAVVAHVPGAETGYARTAGVKRKEPGAGDSAAVAELRDGILAVIAAAGTGAPVPEKGWPIPYFVRRCAWHVLDHAWEIQDKS